MSHKILICYATKYGSTAEVAEAIAATLREKGHTVARHPAQEVEAVDSYDAVVLGTPLYIGQMMQAAHDFLTEHQRALTARALAIFALGPTDPDEDAMRGSVEQFQNEMAQHADLAPITQKVFVGKYDPSKLSLPHKLLAMLPASPLHNRPASDHRDWDAVRAWAEEINAQLGA